MKLDQIEIRPTTGQIQLKLVKTLYDENGQPVYAGNHRDTIAPGDSVKLRQYLAAADADHIEANIWTQEVLDAWQSKNEQ